MLIMSDLITFQLYFIQSVRYQQLVVAKTTDGYYVTIPRDSPFKFHLVSNDKTRQYTQTFLHYY